MLSSPQDQHFMQCALALAHQSELQGEVPVGAVLIRDENIIGQGANAPIGLNDVSAHAELMALRQACTAQRNYRLPNTTLYVTLEPCAMCAGAIVHARVARVVIAAKEPRAGAGGSVFNVLDNPQLNHQCLVDYGVMADESAALLKRFFKARRLAAKQKKQATLADVL